MILETLLYIVFVLSAIVLIVVILLQEGRGGGFGQALGEHGQQTFGVGAKGINTFTGYTAAVFLVSALALHRIHGGVQSTSVLDQTESVDDAFEPPGIGLQPGAGDAGTTNGGGAAEQDG